MLIYFICYLLLFDKINNKKTRYVHKNRRVENISNKIHNAECFSPVSEWISPEFFSITLAFSRISWMLTSFCIVPKKIQQNDLRVSAYLIPPSIVGKMPINCIANSNGIIPQWGIVVNWSPPHTITLYIRHLCFEIEMHVYYMEHHASIVHQRKKFKY